MVSKLVLVARTAVQACPLDTSLEHGGLSCVNPRDVIEMQSRILVWR